MTFNPPPHDGAPEPSSGGSDGAIVKVSGGAEGSALAPLTQLLEGAKELAGSATAKNTRRAYSQQWGAFAKWCSDYRQTALPASPETVASYLRYLFDQKKAVATVQQALAAISSAHKLSGAPSPRDHAMVKLVMRGLRRERGTRQRKAAPIVDEVLRNMLGSIPRDLKGCRDCAVILLGFYGAFRRSELVELRVEDIQEDPKGLIVLLRKTKTDQEGKGTTVAIASAADPAVCPVRAYKMWIEKADISSGKVFNMSDRTVARIVKDRCKAAGIDPERYSGHSMRRGFVTTAMLQGVGERAIMKQTRHRSVTVMREYAEISEVWQDNATVGLLDKEKK